MTNKKTWDGSMKKEIEEAKKEKGYTTAKEAHDAILAEEINEGLDKLYGECERLEPDCEHTWKAILKCRKCGHYRDENT